MAFKLNHQSVNRKNRKRGLSLAEAGLVLGLGMFAFAVAYGFYKAGTDNINTQSQITGAVNLVSNIDRAFRSATYYTDATTANVANGGLVPDAFRVKGTTINHGWGGLLTVSPTAPAATADGYDLVFAKISKESCVEFVTGIEGVANAVKVGSTIVKNLNAATPLPLAVGSLMTACGTLTGDVTIRVNSAVVLT